VVESELTEKEAGEGLPLLGGQGGVNKCRYVGPGASLMEDFW